MIVDPEASSIYEMIAALREAGVERDNAVFQAVLSLFTEIRTLQGLLGEADQRMTFWYERAAELESELVSLTHTTQGV